MQISEDVIHLGLVTFSEISIIRHILRQPNSKVVDIQTFKSS